MWVIHRSLLPRLPWNTLVCPGEDRAWRFHDCLSHRGPGGSRYAGKLVAMGARDPALVEDFLIAWQPAQEGQPWWGLFLAPGSKCKKASPSGGFS